MPFTPPKPLEPAPEDVQGATVLVVDDERVWRVILETDLSMLGYRVSLAEDGYEALARVEADEPDVAVVDLMLPDPMDGRNLLSELRAKSGALSVIFYTAQTEFRPEARDPDVVAYLSKANDRADLYALLPTAIRKTRSRHPQ